jgi:hypothetical protein
MKDQLMDHLKNGNDWERMSTEIDSVFVIRAPGTKSNPKPRLMIEVNPIDETGKPKKRKGLFISTKEMYIQFLEALNDDRIHKLLTSIDEINPVKKTAMKKLKMD